MNSDNYIKFLGTAGARFVVAKQFRYSGGVYLALEGKRLVLDPGPGCLVRCARSRPPIDVTKLDAVILTHAHIDHTSDVNVIIDAMTAGGLRKRGELFAPGECLNGEHRVVLPYLRDFLRGITVLGPSRKYRIGDLRFATSVRHRHAAETYGILFDAGGVKVSFMTDTKYFSGLGASYRDSDILVMNVVRRHPFEFGDILHLSLDDVRRIVAAVRPRTAVITHLGMTMVRLRPRELSAQLSRELHTEVIVATDGMTVPVKG